MTRSMTACWALFALIAVGLLMAPAGVFAHADYERSEPARDEIVPESPPRVDVWFTQELFRRQDENFVRVFDGSDLQVSDGDGVIDDDDRTHMYTDLPPGLPNGRYVVHWLTRSDEDGDSDEGAFCFYIGTDPTAEQAAECAEFDHDEESAPTVTQPPAATSTDAASVASVTPVATLSTAEGEDGDGGSAGLILGGVVGGAVLVAVIGGAAVWLRRRQA